MNAYSKKSVRVMLLGRTEINDHRWNDFIVSSPQSVIYAKTTYLDIVSPDWKAIIATNQNDDFQAVMPLPISKKFNVVYSFNPEFCQYLGVFFRPFNLKKEKEYAFKKRLLIEIINQIPSEIKVFHHNYAPSNDYLLPFFWNGFSMNLRYTYWLRTDNTLEEIFKKFSHRTKTCIKKAKRYQLKYVNPESVNKIMELGKKAGKWQFDEQKLRKLWEVLKATNEIEAVEIRDKSGQLHGGIIYLKCRQKYIYLFGAVDERFKQLGGMSLAIWHIIQTGFPEIKIHDFEGSMIESIEKFYRGFGTVPVPYISVSKNELNFPVKIAHSFYNRIKSKVRIL